MSILGTKVLRTEDPRFLTTGGVYTDDLRLPGACHVQFARSAVAHARIRSVDVSAALAEPGVIAVFTGAASAALTSTEAIRACATVDRTNCTWQAPGSRKSSV